MPGILTLILQGDEKIRILSQILDYIHLLQDRCLWLSPVNTVVNVNHTKVGVIFTIWATISIL